MSSAPTFDELADAALLEMQRQQQEQQTSIERQLLRSNNPFDVAGTTVPGVPAKMAATSTTGGRTVIRKANTATTSSSTAKTLTTSTSPSASTGTPSPSSSVSPTPSSAAPPPYPTPSAASSAVPHDPSAEPPEPAAPAEEASNMEIAQLNESNVAQLLVQKASNANIQQHLTTSLTQQLQSIAAQQTKLAFIREELHKLDQQLSDSIDVLRTQIEDVGRQCLALQADFSVKERDYLDARKALAKAKQRKLLLTGHLDFIILSNEKEKAKKLKELERQMFGPNTAAEGEGEAGGTAPAAKSNGKAAEEVKAPPAPPAFGGFNGDDDGGGGKK